MHSQHWQVIADACKKMLKLSTVHLISNCRVLRTLKFVAAQPQKRFCSCLAKTMGSSTKILLLRCLAGLKFMV